ncbi:MAG: ATP-dependent Clp protease ATP-binding subunit [Clostridia bacterium]|nr:ATP-dependent Clp protease ATP-binding subunit [Clostridia bacterium]
MTKMCSRCKKRMAVVFVTRMDGGKTVNEGLCLKCARELGVKPVNDIIEKMGLSEEDLDAMMDEVTALMPEETDLDGDADDDSGRAPAIDFGAFFPKMGGAVGKEQAGESEKGEGKKEKKTDRKHLSQFCQDLTAKAREGKIDRIVGRDKELGRIMQILCRRQKNNPCLIGEPGVGKTAVAEALASAIVEGRVPYKLKDKEVHLMDMTAIVAGTQFRGQFENRIKGLIDEVKKLGNIILVMDEVHSMVSAGAAEGGMNAANILKPALSRGEIQMIGATTLTEYRKYIEKDSALERRFQPVMIDEPSVEDTVKILKGIKQYYEDYHGIRITDALIRRMVVLSERYITDRYLPDKAIDLMDEAASRLAMDSPVVNRLAELDKELESLAGRIEDMESEELDDEGYRLFGELRLEEAEKKEEFKKLSKKRDKLYLTDDDVARVIEIWTGIPASSITENEFAKIDRLEAELKSRIIGQDEAIGKVARAIKRSRAGVSYKKKPVSFIFAGSTGVGKTELVKVLASYLFDSPESLIRLDMSEFMEKYSVSRIIGSPPGYVGYDDAGQLTEKIRRKPYSVVLFDEIEKAHPDVMNILLQILDDGRITDSHGKEINFENTVIIMTTNAGSGNVSPTAGFSADAATNDRDRTMKALERFLRPEFINRVDEIVVFNRLSKENFKAICAIMLDDLKTVLAEKDITLVWDEAAIDALTETGYSERYGARNLRRLIQTQVEDAVAGKIIENYKTPVTAVSITARDGEIEVCCI